MVLDAETLKPLHELSEEGKSHYSDFLETVADEMLWRKENPGKALVERVVGQELFKK